MARRRTELPGWAKHLDLQPHPEGGWFRETYRSDIRVPSWRTEQQPGDRALATAIMYLLMPGEQSAWHRVSSDELWIHQRGGILGLSLGGDGPAPDSVTAEFLGFSTDEPTFAMPQVLVPAGHWQSAAPVVIGDGDPEPVLVACVVAPGFDFADFEMYDG